MIDWRDVHGYEGRYEVNSSGQVRNAVTGYVLRQSPDERGYMQVGLMRDGKKTTTKVHRIVAKAFVPGDWHLTVNHIDMNKANNAAANLEWLSLQQNLQAAWSSGTHNPRTNEKMRRKLTPLSVDEIKGDHSSGMSYRAIGRKFGITHVNVRAVVLGLQWK